MLSFESRNVLRDGAHIFHTRIRSSYSGRILLSYEGPGGEVTVPEGVAIIGEEAFAFCTHVTDVILPEGVVFIAKKAFYLSGLRNISLPDTLEWIEELAFNQTPLLGIDIPDGTKKVGNMAFFEAAQLQKAKLPACINSLEPGMFSGCVSLKDVVLPAGLEYIQGRTFQNCSALERITLPEELKVVWRDAFSGCTALKEVYFGDSMEEIGYAAFSGCTALEKMRIPATTGVSVGSWGCMILSTDDFRSSNPITIMSIDTMSPVTYSIRPCPKGCSGSGFCPAILNPTIVTTLDPASPRLLNASAIIATEFEMMPADSFAANRMMFKTIPNAPQTTPYAWRTRVSPVFV